MRWFPTQWIRELRRLLPTLVALIVLVAIVALIVSAMAAREAHDATMRQRELDKGFAEVIIPFLTRAYPGTYRYGIDPQYSGAVAIEGSHGDFTVLIKGQDCRAAYIVVNHNNRVERPEMLAIDFSAVIKRKSYAATDDRAMTTIEYDGWGPGKTRPFSRKPGDDEATAFVVHVTNEDAYEQVMRRAIRHCNSLTR